MDREPITRPVPVPDLDSMPYWEGLKKGRLLLQRCAQCGLIRHYPQPVCAECYSMDVTWSATSGRGVIHSWTIAEHAFHPAFRDQLPCILITVDLDEGVRMLGPLRGASPECLRLSLPVRVCFEQLESDIVLPAFVLVAP